MQKTLPSLGLSGAIWFIQRLFPGMKPLTDDLFINLVFGMLVSSTENVTSAISKCINWQHKIF